MEVFQPSNLVVSGSFLMVSSSFWRVSDGFGLVFRWFSGQKKGFGSGNSKLGESVDPSETVSSLPKEDHENSPDGSYVLYEIEKSLGGQLDSFFF